jgi:aldehyde:ferredoxin oxidoreductase
VAGSCFHRVLRVDLTESRCSGEEIGAEVMRSFLGGHGFGVSVLFDQSTDPEPLAPQNPLVFAAGPMNGTKAPGSGGYCTVTRSPLTGGLTSAQANGFFGHALKTCGYDALIIVGRAEELVYLWITDTKIEIRKAEDLSGKDTWEVESILRTRHGGGKRHKVGVACIGPAGENVVRFAAVFSDEGHVAATGGAGAVMGSKNLKAVVAGGSARVTLVNPDAFEKSIAVWRENSKNSPEGRRYNTTGTAGDFTARQLLGSLPVRNLSSYRFPGHEQFSGLALREKYKIKARPCYGCHFTHLSTYAINEGPYKGFVGEEADYEDLAGWGSNLGITDPAAAVWLNNLNDRLGMDMKEATFTISMAIESFTKGLITSRDTDGINLGWDDPQMVAAVLRKIALREGFGNILAEGLVRTAASIGKGAKDLGVYLAKGCAPHVHDVRNLWEVLFSQVISNTPSFESVHVYFNPEPQFGIPIPLDPLDGPSIAKAVAAMITKRQIADSLVVCNFLCRGDFNDILTALNAATGWDITLEEAVTIARRLVTAARLYNYRLGFSVKNDDISPRMAVPPEGGLSRGVSIAPALPEMRRIYYREMGWNPETGSPLPETVQTLGLVRKDVRGLSGGSS